MAASSNLISNATVVIKMFLEGERATVDVWWLYSFEFFRTSNLFCVVFADIRVFDSHSVTRIQVTSELWMSVHPLFG